LKLEPITEMNLAAFLLNSDCASITIGPTQMDYGGAVLTMSGVDLSLEPQLLALCFLGGWCQSYVVCVIPAVVI
jgi:hypothetical protein